MIKPLLKSICLISLMFWTSLCLAGNAVYYAPDGSQITKAEYEKLSADRSENLKALKKAHNYKPKDQSNPQVSIPKSKEKSAKVSQTKTNHLPASEKSKINEADIRKINKDLLDISRNMDAERMAKYLAPSYQVNLQTDAAAMILTRKEYLDYLEAGWGLCSTYKVILEKEKITISGDRRKATAEVDVLEQAMLIDGQSLNVRTHQVSTYEIVDGKILLTKSKARITEL